MNDQQFNLYAKFYDLLYKDKDYQKEAKYIDSLILKYSMKQKSDLSLLDLACGTGKHLFELSGLGYQSLMGSDISSAMIQVAVEQAKTQDKAIEFHNYSFQESNQISGSFDIILSMFSAVNYLTDIKDQERTFRNIYNLLNDKGLFIFDYWNGYAVVRDYSPVKVLRKKHQQAEILRISTTKLDLLRQGTTVTFNCTYLENDKRITEFEEVHHLHYYYFSEMQNLLSTAGFKILHQSPFMQQDKSLDPYDWNISIVAQKD
jgi:SAM-dependent methyltransferase